MDQISLIFMSLSNDTKSTRICLPEELNYLTKFSFKHEPTLTSMDFLTFGNYSWPLIVTHNSKHCISRINKNCIQTCLYTVLICIPQVLITTCSVYYIGNMGIINTRIGLKITHLQKQVNKRKWKRTSLLNMLKLTLIHPS